MDRGLSQEKLAADASMDRAYLGGLERQTENPTIDLLDRLAAVLTAEIAEFFVRPGPHETPPKPLRGGRRPK